MLEKRYHPRIKLRNEVNERYRKKEGGIVIRAEFQTADATRVSARRLTTTQDG